MKQASNTLHPDLLLTQQLVYQPNGLICTHIRKEAESADYGAYDFELNNRHIKFRVAKITPKKIGFFFTLWKRLNNGPILPYDLADPIDLFVVSVRNANHFGQFVFPKIVLYEHKILSKNGVGGKRALRVYPPWITTESSQAQRTQTWQQGYFFEIKTNHTNASMVEKLYTYKKATCSSIS